MKQLCLLFAITGFAALLFGLPDFSLSAGFGDIFNVQGKHAFLKDEYKDYRGGSFGHGINGPAEKSIEAMQQGLFDTKDITLGGGVYGFFDATYAEASVGLVFNRVSQTVDIPNLPDINAAMRGPETHRYLFTQLNLTLLLKYPFALGSRWRVFPLLGADGQIALGDYDEKMREDFKKIKALGYDMPHLGDFWNSLWIRAGAGADFALAGNLFLRGEVLYGIKLNSVYDTQMADYWAEDIRGIASGVNIRLGLGYQFAGK